MPAVVGVEGLSELLWDFEKIGMGLRAGLSKGLRGIGQSLVGLVKARAAAEGLRETGDLIGHVTATVRATTLYLGDSAVRVSPKWPEGFRYPGVYEFGGRGSSAYGPRAFIYPTAEANQPLIEAGLAELLDRLINTTHA